MTARMVLFGFEAFGEERVNPSEAAVRVLHGRRLRGVEVVSAVLPVTYAGAFSTLQAVLDHTQPVAILGVGQGGERFQVESQARNVIGSKLDNQGVAAGSSVQEGGQELLPVTADAPALLKAVELALLASRQDVPAVLSDDAGSYLCNHTLYRALSWVRGRVPCVFVHVPKLKIAAQPLTNNVVEAVAEALAAQSAESLLA
jgi:pyroglutamyl-peptidase